MKNNNLNDVLEFNPLTNKNFDKSKILLGRLFEMVDSQVEGEALAEELLKELGSLSGVIHADFEKLILSSPIPEKCLELLRLLNLLELLSSWSRIENQIIKFSDAPEVIRYLLQKMSHKRVEELRVLYLSVKSTLITEEVVHTGNARSVPVFVETVCERALFNKAKKVIVVHNHPSGDPSPSHEDLAITKDLKNALRALNISLADHLVIGKSTYMSILKSADYRIYNRAQSLLELGL